MKGGKGVKGHELDRYFYLSLNCVTFPIFYLIRYLWLILCFWRTGDEQACASWCARIQTAIVFVLLVLLCAEGSFLAQLLHDY